MNIQIFYHIYLHNHWKETLIEQMYALQMSGLLDNCSKLNIGVLYDNELSFNEMKMILMEYNLDKKINILYKNKTKGLILNVKLDFT